MDKDKKETAKAAKKDKKETANVLETDEVKPEMEEDIISKSDEIEIGEPMDIRPTSLPLVVKVPASASSAQKEYAKILNGYAYSNPEKWKIKKDVLIKRLNSLAGKEVLLDENHSLAINKSRISFTFIQDPTTKEEHYAGPAETGLKE